MIKIYELKEGLARLLVLAVVPLFTQCSTIPQTQSAPPSSGVSRYNTPKRILVFLDGTNNEWNSRTNVRRLFEMVASWQDPNTVCHYMDGVGSSSGLITGNAFGKGMKNRILDGYSFLSRHYRPGDEIYLFGFSRGSLQARSLAGMIAYCGLLPHSQAGEKSELDAVWKLCRDSEENLGENEIAVWKRSIAHGRPPLTDDLLAAGLNNCWAPVAFIGVWDTVPGSSFKEFGTFREKDDNKPGTRYKPGAYPPIRHIAHAMSLDELRSKFRPIRVSPPVIPELTTLNEVWFPGAHSDVGGGYDDSSDLPGLSLNWMIGELRDCDSFWNRLPRVYENPLGPQHRSIDDFPANFASEEERRYRPKNATLHPSVAVRTGKLVPVRRNGDYLLEEYSPKAKASDARY